jgi:hypothetical protein
LIAFFFSSFDHGTFEEVATVSYALMVGIFEFENEPKGEIYIIFMLMLLIELCEVLYERSFQV